jgi:hypothetical protein
VADELIEYVGSIEDPAGLEWVAARLGLALTDPMAPPEAPTAVIESLEARRGTQGATLLAAIAQLCPGRAVEMAGGAVERLRQRGVNPDLPQGLGEHEFGQAQLEKRKSRDFYSFSLRRRGGGTVEIGYFSTRRGRQSGVLHSGVLAKPMPEAEAEELMSRIEQPGVDPSRAMRISAEELAAALRRAAACTIRLEGNLEFELWFALAALARALEIDPAILPAARQHMR